MTGRVRRFAATSQARRCLSEFSVTTLVIGALSVSAVLWVLIWMVL